MIKYLIHIILIPSIKLNQFICYKLMGSNVWW